MPRPKLKVGATFAAARASFEQNRPLIIRLTLGLATLSALSALLNVAGPAGFAISIGITILLSTGYAGMITATICLPGKTESFAEAWAPVKPVLARLIWITLITAVAAVAGMFALIVPGLIILTIWAVAGQAAVVEKTPVFASLGRSYRLVKTTAWQVFAFLLLLALLSLLVMALALVVSAPLGTGAAGRMVGSFLTDLLGTSIVAIGVATLYARLTDLEQTEPPEEIDPPAPS